MISLTRRIVRRIPPLHISTFIGILHLLIGILGAGVITGFSLYFIFQSGEQANLREVEDLVFVIQNAVEEPVRMYEMGNGGSIQDIDATIARYLRERPAVLYTILTRSGMALMPVHTTSCSLQDISLESPEVKAALANTIGHSIRNCSDGTRLIYVATTIQQGENILGVLVLAEPFDTVMAPTYLTMRWMGVIALLIVAFTVAEGWLGSVYISSPLVRLSQTAKMLSQGNLSARAKVEGPVEVADLAQTLNEMSARLQSSLDSLRAFVANASHELRTPLTSIKLQVGALLGGASEEPEVAQRFLSQVDREIDRLVYTVNDMLDLSQIDSGAVPNFQQVNLLDLAQEVEAFWEVRARQAEVMLNVNAVKDLPSIKGDPYQLRRLFDNLLDNAIKNTPTGGKVEICFHFYSVDITHPHEGIRIEVSDSGKGIAAEHLPHIFDRFYRIDPHPRGGGGGSGLGLAIARSIVIAHGGKIGVSSKLGHGSTFWVELPVK